VRIENPEASANDEFGSSVAVLGSDILVGAPFDDPDGHNNAGTVYVFDGATGQQTWRIPNPQVNSANPPDADNDQFGYSIAAVGRRLAIGSYVDAVSGSNAAGTVYVYDTIERDVAVTINNPEPALLDRFGTSIAWVGDRLLVGAQFDDAGGTDSGSAYLFDVDDSSATLVHRYTSTSASDQAGAAVAAIGPHVLLGAPTSSVSGTNAGALLYFEGVELSDTAPLSSLTSLRWLSLSSNQIHDIAPLGCNTSICMTIELPVSTSSLTSA
jgi:hypothetical protein